MGMQPQNMGPLDDPGTGGESDSTRRLTADGPARPVLPDPLLDRIRSTHAWYLRLSRVNAALYYGSRLVAVLCSALLPFVVTNDSTRATQYAIAVAVSVGLDSVFRFREKYQLYSKASDLMAVAEAEMRSDYDKYKKLFQIIVATEEMKVNQLRDLKTILDEVKQTTGR
jgi:hypothetical protein